MDAETLVTVMRNIRDRERQVERLLAQKFARQRDLQDQDDGVEADYLIPVWTRPLRRIQKHIMVNQQHICLSTAKVQEILAPGQDTLLPADAVCSLPVHTKELANYAATGGGDLIAAVHAAALDGLPLTVLSSPLLPAAKPASLRATDEVVEEEEAASRNVRQCLRDGIGAAFKLPGAVIQAGAQHPAAAAAAGLLVVGTGLATTALRRGGALKALFRR